MNAKSLLATAELRALRDDDQRERADLPADPGQEFLRGQYSRDLSRRRRVRELLGLDPPLDPPSLLDAAIVLHHGDQPADFVDAHVLAVLAVLGGVADGQWWAAAALDRLLLHLHEPQIAGTQTAHRSATSWRLPFSLHSAWIGSET